MDGGTPDTGRSAASGMVSAMAPGDGVWGDSAEVASEASVARDSEGRSVGSTDPGADWTAVGFTAAASGVEDAEAGARFAREEGRGGISITGFLGLGAVFDRTTSCPQVTNP